ncbi:MAG TPA: exodeoxyribonuclease VII small subunit, partial [Candidatus Xenobia bacterium]
ELSYEQALARLEQIVYQLEHGEGTLDDALNKFKEGMALSQHCATRLATAEQAIQKVVETAGRISLEPFKTKEA